MQSNQTNQQGQVKFIAGDKVKFKEEVGVQFDHDHKTIYTVEEFQSETRIALVESNYVAYPGDLELVSRPTKHKYYDLIIEWAKDPDNVIIQYKHPCGWVNVACNSPSWCPETEYRIKPKTKQVTRWKWAFLTGGNHITESTAYYTEEEAKRQFKNATPYKLEHTAITEIVEV